MINFDSETLYTQHLCDSLTPTTKFSIGLEYLNDEDNVKVVHFDYVTEIETVLTLAIDYTVDTDTDEITTLTTYPGNGVEGSSDKLTITLSVPYTQKTDITSNSNYDPEVLEEAYDKSVLLAKQNKEEISRAVALSPTDAGEVMVLPPKAALANGYLGFDEDGEPIANSGPTPRAYVSTYTYLAGDITQHSSEIWISMLGTNIGNEPGTDTAWWTLYQNKPEWNASYKYGADDITSYSGVLVKSSQADNINHTPIITPGGAETWWAVVETGGALDVDGELGEATTIRDLVYFDTAGELMIADKGSLEKSIIAGFAVAGGVDGDDVKVRSGGILSGFTGLTIGTQYFLGDTGAYCTAGAISFNDYKVSVGVAVSATEIDVKIGLPEYRSTQDDGNLVGSLHYFPTYSDRAGYIPFAFDNAISQANYPELYSVVGDMYETQHTDAGDAASGAGMFYPTPVPGYYHRTAVPDTAIIDSTDDVDDSTELITLATADYDALKLSRSVVGAGSDGTPVIAKLVSGALPTGLSEDTVYFVRFKTTPDIELYDTEANAIDTSGTTGRVDLTDAVGTFRLTQEGIALDDAFQDHEHEFTFIGGDADGNDQNTADRSLESNQTTYATDGVSTGRTTNETRPRTTYSYGYIKAEYVTPSGEPVSALRYDSGWIANSDWDDNTFNIVHNLDEDLSNLIVKFFVSTDGTEANSFEIFSVGQTAGGGGTAAGGVTFFASSSNALDITTGEDGLLYIKSSGSLTRIDSQAWYYKVVVIKPALIATYADAPIRAVYDISDGTDVTIPLPDANGQTAERTYKRRGAGTGKVLFTTVDSQTIEELTPSTWELEGEGIIVLIPISGNWEVKEYGDSIGIADSGTDYDRVLTKYKSGEAHVEGRHADSLALDTVLSGWYRSDDAIINFGYTFNATVEKVFISSTDTSGPLAYAREVAFTDSLCVGRYMRGDSSGATDLTANWKAIGRWRA